MAGVALDSAPLKGVFVTPASELRGGLPVLKNRKNANRSVMLTPEEFQYAFTNTFSDEESLAMYDRYAVPGPRRPLFEAAFANFHRHAPTGINFKNDDRAPLLIIAGGSDHLSPRR